MLKETFFRPWKFTKEKHTFKCKSVRSWMHVPPFIFHGIARKDDNQWEVHFECDKIGLVMQQRAMASVDNRMENLVLIFSPLSSVVVVGSRLTGGQTVIVSVTIMPDENKISWKKRKSKIKIRSKGRKKVSSREKRRKLLIRSVFPSVWSHFASRERNFFPSVRS